MTRNLKKLIDGRSDLLEEKQRLKESIRTRKVDISESFGAIRDELNPLSIFSGGKDAGNQDNPSKNFLSGIGSSPLVSMGVSTAANFLLKNLFLKKAGFLPRLILPFVVKKASEFIVAPKLNAKLVEKMHGTAEKIRETDIEDVVPKPKELVPDKALQAVAKTSDKIAGKLHDAAEKVRPDEKPKAMYSSSLLKKSPGRKIAKKLHQLADKIRG